MAALCCGSLEMAMAKYCKKKMLGNLVGVLSLGPSTQSVHLLQVHQPQCNAKVKDSEGQMRYAR